MDWNICGLDDLLRKYSSETLATMIFLCIFAISNTVRLVQLVEHQIVVLGVVGSSPTSHPSRKAVTEFIEVTAFLLPGHIGRFGDRNCIYFFCFTEGCARICTSIPSIL